MKKLLFILAVTALMGIGLSQNKAEAVNVEFAFVEFYDWGRNYAFFTDNVHNLAHTNGDHFDVLDANPSFLGGVPGFPADTTLDIEIPVSTAGGAVTFADTFEDTWAIGLIDNIKITGGATIYDSSAPGAKELTFMASGFDDNIIIEPTLSEVRVFSLGGSIQIYKDGAKNFDSSLGMAGRTGFESFLTVTDGSLWLDMDARADATAIPGFTHTLDGSFTFTSAIGFGQGDSDVLMDVVGGSQALVYDTNTKPLGTDMVVSLEVLLNISPDVGGVSDGHLASNAFPFRGGGSAEADVIPEPTTVALLGIGLLGMIGVAGRKRLKLRKNQ